VLPEGSTSKKVSPSRADIAETKRRLFLCRRLCYCSGQPNFNVYLSMSTILDSAPTNMSCTHVVSMFLMAHGQMAKSIPKLLQVLRCQRLDAWGGDRCIPVLGED
jgi:hypothetical protein